MEEGVFHKAKESRLQFELAYENQIRERIHLIIADYNTGLDESSAMLIPEWIYSLDYYR